MCVKKRKKSLQTRMGFFSEVPQVAPVQSRPRWEIFHPKTLLTSWWMSLAPLAPCAERTSASATKQREMQTCWRNLERILRWNGRNALGAVGSQHSSEKALICWICWDYLDSKASPQILVNTAWVLWRARSSIQGIEESQSSSHLCSLSK